MQSAYPFPVSIPHSDNSTGVAALSMVDGGGRIVIGPWSILGSMSPSQDLGGIGDVTGNSVPVPDRVTGYQGDSACGVPLYAQTAGFCGDIVKPLFDLGAWVIHKGKRKT